MYPDTLPWYKSKIIVGAIVSILTKVLVLTGVLDSAFDAGQLTDALVLIVGLIADFVIAISRKTQKAAPAITA